MNPYLKDEITSVVPEWENLLNIDSGFVCVHTFNVLYLTYINHEASLMSKRN